jgi:alpha-L-rhamnosidase
MRRIGIWAVAIGIVALTIAAQTQANARTEKEGIQAARLRCEYRVDPQGIDVVKPRLSWILESKSRDQKQTAYQVLAASSIQRLKKNEGDLWDSGKVQSDETTAIVYDGKSLPSGSACFWKVKVWDQGGNESQWSDPATWSAGLLNPEDWKAQWIGLDTEVTVKPTPEIINQTNWIWTEPTAHQSTVPGERFFRRSFEIPSGWDLAKAVCYITADDAFELFVNGQQVNNTVGFRVIHQVPIDRFLKPGRNSLAVMAANHGNSPNPAGLIVAVTIESQDGDVLEIISDAEWKASSKKLPNWQAANFDDASWPKASLLGKLGMASWGKIDISRQILPPAQYLRGTCSVASGKIKKASLYATALGIYQLYVNGQRIGEDYFSPGWTDYTKRIYYYTYDVTENLKRGDNAIGAILADGWYAGYIGYAYERNHYGRRLRLLCQLNIEYEDGTTQVIATGPDWKASLGPIVHADFLHGESYDARREMPGWNTAKFDDANWQKVTVGSDEVHPKVQAAVSQPVVAFEEVKPVTVSEPRPGEYVFDMGQNFAGVVRLRIKGKTGQTIQLRHAERLNPDGTIYTTNLRAASATDTYICKGGGTEIWQPYFTFHGFQYVELTGVESKPSLNTIVGLALSSDTPTAGTFVCSDPMVNQIQSNSVWTQRANFIDIPTDCPQRDERLGWTGDAQVYINTAAYHNDVHAFFTKWLVDLNDAQRDDGQYPMVAPLKVAGDDGGPAWADAGVICPGTIYKMYGDKRILETHYDQMAQFIAFCKNRCTDELLPPKEFHCFGDWLNINDDTPKDVIYMAYFGYSTQLMADIADALGKTADKARYNQLFEQIKVSFNKAYVQPNGKIKGDTQTAYVMAIAYDLLDDEMQQLAAEHLIRRIQECNWHLSTGFVGTKDLMLVLAKIGRNDIAYRLLHNDTFPSWGFSIKHGATSIWERWNGWTPEQGFGDPGMNSFAHYSFGAVCQWIFENVGGIQTDGPAFKHIVLKPRPGGKLTWAKTAYQSIRGEIETDWQVKDHVFHCRVTIPPNTTATLYLPAADAKSVLESKKPLDQANGILAAVYQSETMVLELGSGQYVFQSPLKQAAD